jgi:hypothetical protein
MAERCILVSDWAKETMLSVAATPTVRQAKSRRLIMV